MIIRVVAISDQDKFASVRCETCLGSVPVIDGVDPSEMAAWFMCAVACAGIGMIMRWDRASPVRNKRCGMLELRRLPHSIR